MLCVPLSPRHGASSGCGWSEVVTISNKQYRTADTGWSSSLGVWVRRQTTPYRKKTACYEMLHITSELTDTVTNLLLLLRWLYSPMRTFTSLMDFSQSSESI
jgi:hypothetical protein